MVQVPRLQGQQWFKGTGCMGARVLWVPGLHGYWHSTTMLHGHQHCMGASIV